MCLPFMHKDHAIMLLAPDMKRAAEAVLLAQGEPHTPRATVGGASVLERLGPLVRIIDKPNIE